MGVLATGVTVAVYARLGAGVEVSVGVADAVDVEVLAGISDSSLHAAKEATRAAKKAISPGQPIPIAGRKWACNPSS